VKMEQISIIMNAWSFDSQVNKSAILRYKTLFGHVCLVTALGAALVLTSATAWCEEHYRVDPGGSEVHFSLVGPGHTVEGTFHVTSGEFSLDPQSNAMSGTVAVDAASGQSDNKNRDKKMTNDQMKAQAFPSVTFAPTKFTGQVKDSGDSTGQVDGTFTLLGQAHAITVPMTVHMEGDRFTAAGSFTVPYVTWGVKDPSWAFVKVAKDVKIDLKLAGTVTR
jgi:polyisoprenoid-binding protein YceI